MKIKKHTYIVKSLIITLMIILYGISAKAQTSTVYPADISVTLTPPYGTCLTDLAGSDRFRIQVLLRDMTHPDYEMVVQMRLRSLASQQTVFVSRTNKFSVNAGKPVVLIGKEGMSDVSISQFFDTENDNVKNGRNFCTDNCLPEGAYIFSFQLYDYQSYERNNPIPVSREVTFTAFLEGGATPILIAPANNDSICNVNSIHFSWMQPYVTSGINTYRLQVVEAKNGIIHPDMFNNGNNLRLDTYCLVPSYTWNKTEGAFQENTTYGWRVVMCDAKGNPRKSYPNGGASEVRRFVYCGEKQDPVPDPDAGWVQQVPKAKTINDKLDIVRLDTVKMDAASSASAFCQKDPQEIRDKYSGIIVEVKKVSHDLWSPFTLESTAQLDTVIALGQLAYGEEYHARAQYFAYDGEKIKYAPYSDTVTFSLRHPADTIECGGELPKLTSTETDKNSTLQKGDVFTANGRSVTILELTRANTGELSGTGYINFPILSNFKLKVQFENLKLNAEKELVSGEITSVYDKSTAATIDLNNTIGRGAGGYDMPEKAPNIDDVPSGIHGSVYSDNSNSIMLDTEEGPINIASPIDLSTSGAYEDNDHRTDHQLVRFSNPDPQNIAFDDDGENLYRKASRLSGQYEKFAPDYIIPWVATNSGRTFSLTAKPDKDFNYTDLRFVLKTTSGHIELNTEKNNDGTTYSVTIPGTVADNVTHVYAIARPSADEPFENVGHLKVACYERRTQKVVLVPLAQQVQVSTDVIREYLNDVYGKLGYSFEVNYDNIESHTKDIDRNPLDIESGLLTQYSDAMKNVVDKYISNVTRSGESLDRENTVYLFLMDKSSDGETEGIMPQKHPFGFIFLKGNNISEENSPVLRTIAHELGHGLWGLDHIFDRAYGIQQGTTTNLMDYTDRTPSTYLAHFQWNLISKPSYNWSLFTGDEGNEYKPWSFVGSELVEHLEDITDKNKEYFTVLTPNYIRFALPKKAKNIYFINGCVISFVIDGELWYAIENRENNEFLGYFKDVKSNNNGINNIANYNLNDIESAQSYPLDSPLPDNDYVYTVMFDKDSEESSCNHYDIYKISYTDGQKPDFMDIYADMIILRHDRKLKGKDKLTLSGDAINAYKVSEHNMNDVNCLPYSVKKFYLFMTEYYTYFSDEGKKEELLDLLGSCSEVRIKRIDKEDDEYGKKENLIEAYLLSDKNDKGQVETLISNLSKTIHVYGDDTYLSDIPLLISFDSYSAFSDYYLTPNKCTKEQWEMDLKKLDLMVYDSDYDVYELCEFITDSICHDYLKTVDYKTIERYINCIISKCDRTKIKKFNNTVENAVLWLMTTISNEDIKLFVEYLSEPNYNTLNRFMDDFDDVSINPFFDGNNYTRFMQVLCNMFKRNPDAFMEEISVDEWYLAGKLLNLSPGSHYSLRTNEDNKVTLVKYTPKIEYIEGRTYTTYDETIVNGYENVSPFLPIFLIIDSDNPELIKDVAQLDEKTDKKILACPIIFMEYRQDKIGNEEMKKIAEIAIDVATIYTGVGSVKLAYSAFKYAKVLNNLSASAKAYIGIKASLSTISIGASAEDILSKMKVINGISENVQDCISLVGDISSNINSIDELYKSVKFDVIPFNYKELAQYLPTLWHTAYVSIPAFIKNQDYIDNIIDLKKTCLFFGVDIKQKINKEEDVLFISTGFYNYDLYNDEGLKKFINDYAQRKIVLHDFSDIIGHPFSILLSYSDYNAIKEEITRSKEEGKDPSFVNNELLTKPKTVFFDYSYEDYYSLSQGKIHFNKIEAGRMKIITGSDDVTNEGYILLSGHYQEDMQFEICNIYNDNPKYISPMYKTTKNSLDALLKGTSEYELRFIEKDGSEKNKITFSNRSILEEDLP